MPDYQINASDTLPVLSAWPLDVTANRIGLGNGAGQIPSGSTAVLIITSVSGVETSYNGTIQDDGAGKAQVHVSFATARPAPGLYRFRLRITYPDTNVQSFPNGDIQTCPTMLVSQA